MNFLRLLKREFKLFWSNSVLRLLFFGAPIMYGVLLGYVYNKGKVTDLPIIVVDYDHSQMTAKALEMMEDNEVLHVIASLPDIQDVDRLMIEKDVASVVIFPKDFEKNVMLKRYPEVTTIVNTANVLTANYASTALQVILGTMKVGVQLETLRKQGTPEHLLMSQYEPFKTTFVKKNNRATNYMYFLWPGVLAAVFQQVLLLGLALSFASEFESGSFSQLIKETKSTGMMIVVKILPYLLMSVLIWLMYGGFAWWFRIPFEQHVWDLTWIAGIFVLAVSFIGILVSILIPNQLKATEVLMVIATPAFILSGFTWPLSQMPEAVQYLAKVIPLTHFLPAMRILMIENGSVELTYPYVNNLLITLGIGAVLSYIALLLKKKKWLKDQKRLQEGESILHKS